MLFYYLLSGICLFSLIDCIADRKVSHQSYIMDHSRCDSCHHPLAFYDLIPIISYLHLRGKCRYCGKKIPIETILMEIAGGLIGILAYTKGSFLILLLTGNLILIALIDYKSMDVYLDTVLSLTFLILLMTWNDFDLMERLPGMICIPFIMSMINIIQKDSFGLGDLEVSSVMGWYFGFPQIILLTWIGTLAGMIFFILMNKRKLIGKKEHFCFLPFLTAGYMIGIIFF